MTSRSDAVSGHAAELLRMAVVWDDHACFPFSMQPDCLRGLERYVHSGVTCVHVNIGDADLTLENQIRTAAAYRHFLRSHASHYLLVESVEDILRAKSSGRLAVCFDVEGAVALGEQLSIVELYRDLGVRWFLPVYNRANLLGGGCHDQMDAGLTTFGRQVIDELDRVGIVKDCSHTGYRTARDVLEASRVPVTFSHSNPRRLVDHPRNIPDDLIQACARTGGVVGIAGIGIFLGRNDNSTAAVVRHIRYVIDLVGPRHVGLGLDYYGVGSASGAMKLSPSRDFWPTGFGYGPGMTVVEPERIPMITDALLSAGLRDEEVKGVLGENFLRVARQVWK